MCTTSTNACIAPETDWRVHSQVDDGLMEESLERQSSPDEASLNDTRVMVRSSGACVAIFCAAYLRYTAAIAWRMLGAAVQLELGELVKLELCAGSSL